MFLECCTFPLFTFLYSVPRDAVSLNYWAASANDSDPKCSCIAPHYLPPPSVAIADTFLLLQRTNLSSSQRLYMISYSWIWWFCLDPNWVILHPNDQVWSSAKSLCNKLSWCSSNIHGAKISCGMHIKLYNVQSMLSVKHRHRRNVTSHHSFSLLWQL